MFSAYIFTQLSVVHPSENSEKFYLVSHCSNTSVGLFSFLSFNLFYFLKKTNNAIIKATYLNSSSLFLCCKVSLQSPVPSHGKSLGFVCLLHHLHTSWLFEGRQLKQRWELQLLSTWKSSYLYLTLSSQI